MFALNISVVGKLPHPDTNMILNLFFYILSHVRLKDISLFVTFLLIAI